MSKSSFYRKLCFCTAAVLAVGSFSGCGRGTEEGKEKQPEQETKNGFAVTDTAVSEVFSVEDYAGQVRDDLTPIAECRKNYGREAEELKKTEFPNLHFENCAFRSFPEMEDMELLVTLDQDKYRLDEKEKRKIIISWGKNAGKDIEKDIRSDPGVLYSDGMNLGAFAFDYYIMADGDGIHYMFDGKINEYMGEKLSDSNYYIGDTVDSGTLEELGDREYPLLSGSLTVAEGAEIARDYFRKGTPFPPSEGMDIDIIGARVFPLKDVFGYEYQLQRTYHTVPISLAGSGSYHFYGDYAACGDPDPFALVVDNTGVTCYNSVRMSQILHSLGKGNKILSAAKMGELVSSGLAGLINVDAETAGLSYFPVWFDDGENDGIQEEIDIFPCWEIRGKNRVKNEDICIYLDVFTGRLFFYTKS